MWLTIRSGEQSGTSVRVAGERFLVGRLDDCDLVLPGDPKVSRRHACLEPLLDGGALLRDLGSANGTFVDGRRVESAELRGGEQLQFGGTVLSSSLEEPLEAGRATFVGSLVSALRPGSDSAVHRLVLQRSVRRATGLGLAALAVTAGVGVLLAFTALRDDPAAAAVERVVRAAAPSTLLIEARRRGLHFQRGTGWVLDGKDGLVVTNAHVVNGGTTFRVGVGGGFRTAEVVGVAPCEDLAVLRTAGALAPLALGDQRDLELGETVVALGYPANASQEPSLTSTTGVVSVVRSSYRDPGLDVPRYANVIQTDAAINPGSSGGPLLDLSGRLVGVNAAGRRLTAEGRIIEGQSYAIGVDRVKRVAAVLRTGRSIGWTGLGFDYPTPREVQRRRLPAGLPVAPAVAGTAAAEAGLGESGGVVVAVNGMRITGSLASYCDAVAGMGSGQKVMLTVLERGGSTRRDVRLTLE